MSYATVADFRAYLGQVPAGAAEDALITSVLSRATKIIDTDLGFAFGTSAVGTAAVYGDGTDYLRPPAFVTGSVTSVTAPSGYTAPLYIEQDGYLVVTRGGRIGASPYGYYYGGYPCYSSTGWWMGLPYTVSATYGYAAVPADIVECCLEIAVRIWRARDAGFSDVIGVEGADAVGYNGALPAMVKRILDHYRSPTGGIY